MIILPSQILHGFASLSFPGTIVEDQDPVGPRTGQSVQFADDPQTDSRQHPSPVVTQVGQKPIEGIPTRSLYSGKLPDLQLTKRQAQQDLHHLDHTRSPDLANIGRLQHLRGTEPLHPGANPAGVIDGKNA